MYIHIYIYVCICLYAYIWIDKCTYLQDICIIRIIHSFCGDIIYMSQFSFSEFHLNIELGELANGFRHVFKKRMLVMPDSRGCTCMTRSDILPRNPLKGTGRKPGASPLCTSNEIERPENSFFGGFRFGDGFHKGFKHIQRNKQRLNDVHHVGSFPLLGIQTTPRVTPCGAAGIIGISFGMAFPRSDDLTLGSPKPPNGMAIDGIPLWD